MTLHKDKLNINVPFDTKVVVVGDIHGHPEQFEKLVDKVKPSKNVWLVSCGDILDKGFGLDAENKIIDYFRVAEYQGFGFVVKGNHEFKRIRQAKRERHLMTEQLSWLRKQSIALSFKFSDSSRVTIVHAGITHRYTWEDLDRNSEVCYVRTLDKDGDFISLVWETDKDGVKYLKPKKEGGVTWHKSYDGRFGYVAAGHDPQEDGVAKFYEHSCNLDSACYETGKLSAQVFSNKGLEDLIVVEGTPSKPEGIGQIRR